MTDSRELPTFHHEPRAVDGATKTAILNWLRDVLENEDLSSLSTQTQQELDLLAWEVSDDA